MAEGEKYEIGRGPADPFRGDWYDQLVVFDDCEKAVLQAYLFTLENYRELGTSWEAYGYEWSVFKITNSGKIKVWEGYRCITTGIGKNLDLPLEKDGWLNSMD